MIPLNTFVANLKQVQLRIAKACRAADRSVDSVTLLPVTKNHPVDAVDYAAQYGLLSIGENRVQEASKKRKICKSAVSWELIGHLQSNKARDAVGTFDRIQSVDSMKLLKKLDRYAAEAGKCLPILLQCNIGKDPNKSGFLVESMPRALELALSLDSLQVDGLMTIAPLDDSLDVARHAFEELRILRDNLSNKYNTLLQELSMGMTGDLEQAIAAGSTQIRIGSALYGSRI